MRGMLLKDRGGKVALLVCALFALSFSGCFVAPQTYDPTRLHSPPGIRGFLPDDYSEDLTSPRPPWITVQVRDGAGALDVSVCSRGWDYRRIHILSDQCSLTDASGRRYRLDAFVSNDFANKDIGASRWIQYFTRAYGPLPSSKAHQFYGQPHTLRVVYTEDGKRYFAERQFAATYPVITPLNVLPLTDP